MTGAPVLVAGRFVKTPSFSTSRVNVLCKLTFMEGHPFARTTHMSIETRPVGRADVTIIESPLSSDPESTGGSLAASSAGSVTFGVYPALETMAVTLDIPSSLSGSRRA